MKKVIYNIIFIIQFVFIKKYVISDIIQFKYLPRKQSILQEIGT